ncbi:MAG: T9SS type A sorting domain-containing protein [Flavobacteriaceae bacterium]|nr:T9SS type A sorting domain-containing protein [Flavobacteriaceae bacterium]
MKSCQLFSTIISLFSLSILVAQDPPANNAASGAVMLTIQSESCYDKSTATIGTFADATHSGQAFNNNGCVGNENADSITDPVDVWYKVEVPSSGKFKMYAEGNYFGESSLTAVLFTESAGIYTRFDCTEIVHHNSILEITGRTEGEIIYIQILSNEELYAYDGTDFSTFTLDICVFHSETLDLPQTQKPLLSYYSNPMGNRLRVESPYDIQSLAVYDLVGREVLTKSPQKQKLTLDTYSLAPGVYLLNVQTAEGQQTVKLVKK